MEFVEGLVVLGPQGLPDGDDELPPVRDGRAQDAADRGRGADLDNILVKPPPKAQHAARLVLKELIFPKRIHRHEGGPVGHGHLGEPLSVFEIEHVLVCNSAGKKSVLHVFRACCPFLSCLRERACA